MGGITNAYKLSIGKHDGRKPLLDKSLDERLGLTRSSGKK
jgi:hypothetical protein